MALWTDEDAPVIAMKPKHLVLLSKILEDAKGQRHKVSFDVRGISSVKLVYTALRFKQAIIKNQDRLNALIVKITVHVNPSSLEVVKDMVLQSQTGGMTVPIEIKISQSDSAD